MQAYENGYSLIHKTPPLPRTVISHLTKSIEFNIKWYFYPGYFFKVTVLINPHMDLKSKYADCMQPLNALYFIQIIIY